MAKNNNKMSSCVRKVIAEGKPQKQAVAICLSKKTKGFRADY